MPAETRAQPANLPNLAHASERLLAALEALEIDDADGTLIGAETSAVRAALEHARELAAAAADPADAFTPAPWCITDNGHETRPDAIHGGASGCILATTWAIVPESERLANARLMTASPRLLAALRQCVRAYEIHRDNQPTGRLWPDPNHIFHARAAIRSATAAA